MFYAMCNFFGFLFSCLKGIWNTCAKHTQVNKQASVARILLAGFSGIFSKSNYKFLSDAQISKYNKQIINAFSIIKFTISKFSSLSNLPNAYDIP